MARGCDCSQAGDFRGCIYFLTINQVQSSEKWRRERNLNKDEKW